MKTLAFAALLFAGFFQQNPQSQLGAIEGTIVRTGTTTPVSGVQVQIEARARPPFTAATTSDDRGHFLLPNIPAGMYTLTIQREGFLRSAVNSRFALVSPSLPNFTTIEVHPGQTLRVANLSLTPPATIRGRILDSDASPLAGLAVDLARMTGDEQGRKSLQRVAAPVRTDDQGEYRISMIAPGEYYIRAFRTPSVFDIGELVVPIYFPGTLDPLTAAAVAVSAGGEMTADFHTPPVAKYAISGAVVHSLPGVLPLPQLSFQLLPRNRMNFDNVGNSSLLLVPEGSSGFFEFRGVPAGLFDLHVQGNSSGKTYSASAEIEVRDKDLKDLSLTLNPGRDVKGRLIVVGDTPRNLRLISSQTDPANSADRWGEIRLYLGRKTGVSGGELRIDDDGKRFTFENVPDGSYTLSTRGLAFMFDNNYLVDVRVGGRTVPNQEILVGSDAVDSIEVVIGTDGASIQGTVEGITRDGAQVILVPDQQRWQNPSLFQSVNLFDGSGTFVLRGIAPGDYRLLAFSGTQSVPFRSEEFLALYGPRMKTIAVQKGAVLTGVQVPLIRATN